MEPAPFMISPRVTKCGHIFCWPCLLQYLAFEKTHAWKKCPLCAESIYKHDIRRATIIYEHGEAKAKESLADEKKTITFSLMVRNKSNINVKEKTEDTGDSCRTILNS